MIQTANHHAVTPRFDQITGQVALWGMAPHVTPTSQSFVLTGRGPIAEYAITSEFIGGRSGSGLVVTIHTDPKLGDGYQAVADAILDTITEQMCCGQWRVGDDGRCELTFGTELRRHYWPSDLRYILDFAHETACCGQRLLLAGLETFVQADGQAADLPRHTAS